MDEVPGVVGRSKNMQWNKRFTLNRLIWLSKDFLTKSISVWHFFMFKKKLETWRQNNMRCERRSRCLAVQGGQINSRWKWKCNFIFESWTARHKATQNTKSCEETVITNQNIMPQMMRPKECILAQFVERREWNLGNKTPGNSIDFPTEGKNKVKKQNKN